MQVLRANPNVKSFGQRLNEGIGSGLQTLEQYQKQAEEAAKQKKFADEVKRLYDIDVSGMSREGGEKLATEAYKQKAKFKNQLDLIKQFGLGEYFGEEKTPQEMPQPGGMEGQENAPEKDQPFDWEVDDLVTNKPKESKKGMPQPKEQNKPSDKLIPESQIAAMNLINRDVANTMQKHNDRIIQQQNLEAQESRKDIRSYHKESEKYDDELFKNYKSAEHQLSAIEDVTQAIKSDKVKPTSLANIFRSFGDTGRKISDALLSGEEATLLSSIPAFLEGRKELFGVRLSDADLRLLQDKLPDIGKSKEANLAIMNLMKKYAKQSTLRYKIGQDIKKENKGLRPLGYRDKIEEKYERMTSPVKIVNPNNGKVISIPAYELSNALEAGATLYQEEQNEQL